MCVSCETYDYSRNCGPRCEDHAYEVDEGLSDDEDTMFRCSRCGSCKMVEVASDGLV